VLQSAISCCSVAICHIRLVRNVVLTCPAGRILRIFSERISGDIARADGVSSVQSLGKPNVTRCTGLQQEQNVSTGVHRPATRAKGLNRGAQTCNKSKMSQQGVHRPATRAKCLNRGAQTCNKSKMSQQGCTGLQQEQNVSTGVYRSVTRVKCINRGLQACNKSKMSQQGCTGLQQEQNVSTGVHRPATRAKCLNRCAQACNKSKMSQQGVHRPATREKCLNRGVQACNKSKMSQQGCTGLQQEQKATTVESSTTEHDMT